MQRAGPVTLSWACKELGSPLSFTVSGQDPRVCVERTMIRKVSKAVFPVAGLGTRFLPATKSIPKEMLTLVDRPLIQYAVDEARAAGITEFIFVTARGKSALEDYFDRAPELEAALCRNGKSDLLATLSETNMASGAIAYVRQHQALGLGHAVWCARRLIGWPAP
jgi:UTP--glucose-1-phosphate uridylyltransferase